LCSPTQLGDHAAASSGVLNPSRNKVIKKVFVRNFFSKLFKLFMLGITQVIVSKDYEIIWWDGQLIMRSIGI
ncbi:MAG: hypothetical protein KAI26_00035, partial [Nanoarchaeota archaeon]|nr:hypothetical protein [Nanoarchaeota archaeon]